MAEAIFESEQSEVADAATGEEISALLDKHRDKLPVQRITEVRILDPYSHK